MARPCRLEFRIVVGVVGREGGRCEKGVITQIACRVQDHDQQDRKNIAYNKAMLALSMVGGMCKYELRAVVFCWQA